LTHIYIYRVFAFAQVQPNLCMRRFTDEAWISGLSWSFYSPRNLTPEQCLYTAEVD